MQIDNGCDINGKNKNYILDYNRAREIMTDNIYNESEHQKWALEQKLGVVVESRYITLVTAAPRVLFEFEESFKPQEDRLCTS